MAAKTRKKAKAKKKLVCAQCGLVVTVDNFCGCGDECDLLCCGEQMKPKKSK